MHTPCGIERTTTNSAFYPFRGEMTRARYRRTVSTRAGVAVATSLPGTRPLPMSLPCALGLGCWRSVSGVLTRVASMSMSKTQRLRNAAEGFMGGLLLCGFSGPWVWAHHEWEGAFYKAWRTWPPKDRAPKSFPTFKLGGGAG